MLNVERRQSFVGGAIAVIGLHGIHALFLEIAIREKILNFLFVYFLAESLMLPLGIGLLVGNAKAVTVTKIYLWLAMVVIGIIFVCILLHIQGWDYSHPTWTLVTQAVVFVAFMVLQMMLYWKKVKC